MFLTLTFVMMFQATADPVVPPPTTAVDTLLNELADTQAQRAVLEKKANELTTQIDAKLKELNQKLADLKGRPISPITPPGPVTPDKPDALKVSIAAAYAKDIGAAADKKTWAVTLSGYYSAASDKKLAEDTTITTGGMLLDRIRATVTLDATKLPNVRNVISGELMTIMGTTTAPLDANKRAALSKLFLRVETSLDEVIKNN